MGALADIWKSERGIIAVVLIIAATVLAAIGTMTIDAWKDFTLAVFGIYASMKTVTGAVKIWKSPTEPADTKTGA